MSYTKGEKLKQKIEVKFLTWQEKKKAADDEEEAITKLIKEHTRWVWQTTMIDEMDNQQMKVYLKERPESLKTIKIDTIKRVKKVQKNTNMKSIGIMSTVWKFHRKDDK